MANWFLTNEDRVRGIKQQLKQTKKKVHFNIADDNAIPAFNAQATGYNKAIEEEKAEFPQFGDPNLRKSIRVSNELMQEVIKEDEMEDQGRSAEDYEAGPMYVNLKYAYNLEAAVERGLKSYVAELSKHNYLNKERPQSQLFSEFM